MASATVEQINEALDAYNAALGAPAGMLLGIAKTESAYNEDTGRFLNVRNSIGATGLMQLMPIALKDIKRAFGYDIDPYDPLWSVFGAALMFVLNYRYLSKALGRAPSWEALIVAYNGGWTAGKYYELNGRAPSAEGRNYIAKVNNVMSEWTYA